MESEEVSIIESDIQAETAISYTPSLLSGNGGNSSEATTYKIEVDSSALELIDANAWQDVIQAASQLADSAMIPTSQQVERMHSYLTSGGIVLPMLFFAFAAGCNAT